ncbi:unnamed protein product [Rhizophagus irregularis]|nr:unnamed protein product [Rhizophagus irregularis]
MSILLITKPPQVEISSDIVSRPKIMKLLKGILQPNEDQSSYILCGQDDKGTQGGMGVPANIEKFAEEFAKAINFSFEKCVPSWHN